MAAKPERSAGYKYCDLPHELWREILNKLPVKSILRCRSVCKSWYSLASCPNFISHYKNDNRVLVQVSDNITDVMSYSSHDESFMESRQHDDLPEPFRGENVRIVGSCNGLICLSEYDDYSDANNLVATLTLQIWNPTIRKTVEVPSRTLCSRTQELYCLGFGFDSNTNDYKVLCAVSDFSGSVAVVFEIFDARKGVWRTISPPVLAWSVAHSYYPECYLDGAVHWTGYSNCDGHDHTSCDRILLSFSMRDELFHEIRMPDSLGSIDGDDNRWTQTRSVAFGGLIHLMTWVLVEDDIAIDMSRDCSVWIMKEYGVTESWTKLFSIDL